MPNVLKLIQNAQLNENHPEPDYKTLYLSLYNRVTKACNDLLLSQSISEDEYLRQTEPIVLVTNDKEGTNRAKPKGIKRHIDNNGRLVIPSEYRDALKINNGDSVEILMIGKGILIQKSS